MIGSEIHRIMPVGNIGKQIAGMPNFTINKSKVQSVNIAGKVINLSPNLALKITKYLIRKAIDKGIGKHKHLGKIRRINSIISQRD